MNREALEWLLCPDCMADLEAVAFEQEDDQVVEGRLVCHHCSSWFRIESGIADLLPANLRRKDLYQAFALRHGIAVDDPETPGPTAEDGDENQQKRGQIEFFKQDTEFYEEKVAGSSYYSALDQLSFQDWMRRKLKPGSRVLDLGCGAGRAAVPFGEHGARVLGVDICEEMVLVAQRKVEARGMQSRLDFVVGDAERPPIREGLFDACLVYGSLHHITHPEIAIKNAAKKLVKGGDFYTLDPHDSPVRFIFDFLMKIHELYEEEANDSPLISERRLNGWLEDAGLEGKTRLSTYLPPHLMYVLSTRLNRFMIGTSDRILNAIPYVRKLGGVIISEGVRTR